jgi:hypothetical protein
VSLCYAIRVRYTEALRLQVYGLLRDLVRSIEDSRKASVEIDTPLCLYDTAELTARSDPELAAKNRDREILFGTLHAGKIVDMVSVTLGITKYKQLKHIQAKIK